MQLINLLLLFFRRMQLIKWMIWFTHSNNTLYLRAWLIPTAQLYLSKCLVHFIMASEPLNLGFYFKILVAYFFWYQKLEIKNKKSWSAIIWNLLYWVYSFKKENSLCRVEGPKNICWALGLVWGRLVVRGQINSNEDVRLKTLWASYKWELGNI